MSSDERDVNVLRSCRRGHGPPSMSTTAPRTACPAHENRVHDAGNWVPDRQNLMQTRVIAGQSTLDVCPLSSSRTGCYLRQSHPHTVDRQGVVQSPPPAPPDGAITPAPGCPVDKGPHQLFPAPAIESTPRRGGSQPTTRHVCLHQPTPAPATPFQAPNKPRPHTGMQAPSAHPRPQGRGCADP